MRTCSKPKGTTPFFEELFRDLLKIKWPMAPDVEPEVMINDPAKRRKSPPKKKRLPC